MTLRQLSVPQRASSGLRSTSIVSALEDSSTACRIVEMRRDLLHGMVLLEACRTPRSINKATSARLMVVNLEHVCRLSSMAAAAFAAEKAAKRRLRPCGGFKLRGFIVEDLSESLNGNAVKMQKMPLIVPLEDSMLSRSSDKLSPVGTMIQNQLLPLRPVLFGLTKIGAVSELFP